jgi:hypothetical protein
VALMRRHSDSPRAPEVAAVALSLAFPWCASNDVHNFVPSVPSTAVIADDAELAVEIHLEFMIAAAR